MIRWTDLLKWTKKQIAVRERGTNLTQNKRTEIELLNKFKNMVDQQQKAHCSDLDTYADEVMSFQQLAYDANGENEKSVIPTEEVIKLFTKLGFWNINRKVVSNFRKAS